MGIYVIYTWDVCTKAVNFHPRHWTLEYCPTQTDNYGNEWELWYLKHVTIIISLNVSTTIYKLLKLKVPFLRVYLKPSHHVSSYCSIIIWADICSILFMGKIDLNGHPVIDCLFVLEPWPISNIKWYGQVLWKFVLTHLLWWSESLIKGKKRLGHIHLFVSFTCEFVRHVWKFTGKN